MCADNQHGSGCLETYAALDADNRIAYVHITADAVSRTDFLYLLDSLDGVVEFFIVDRFKFTLLEGQAQLFAAFFGAMFQIGAFGKSLCGVQNLTAANGSTPQTYVIGIFQFGEVGCKAVLVQIIYLFLAAQSHVACQRDNFHARSHDKESHVETNLVVTRTGRTMCNGVCADFVGVACNGQRLEYTFGAYGNRISTVTQYVAEYHVFQALFVIFLRYVQSNIFYSTQFVGVLFVCLQLFGAETAGIGTSRIYLVSFLFGQIHNCE